MLQFLRIKNLALIQDAELEFAPGLNVITGESGAGKSIILKALDFLLGENLPWKIVRQGKERAFVEAIFSNQEKEVIIRREIMPQSARSRLYINDNLSSRNKVLELRNRLIVYTSQHEQHKLLKSDYHTKLLDEHLPLNLIQKKEFLTKKIAAIQQKIANTRQQIAEIDSQKDFLEYQLKEIQRVSPAPNEEEVLLKKREDLKNNAKLREKIDKCLELIDSDSSPLLDQLIVLTGLTKEIANLDDDFNDFIEPLEQAKETIVDLEIKLKSYPIGFEQVAELENIESRLFEIEQLKRKLNKSLDEIINLKEILENKISKMDELKLEIKKLEKIRQTYISELKEVINSINNLRADISQRLEGRIKKELVELGFHKDIGIKFDFFSVELLEQVEEKKARILWSPNPGQPMQPIEQTVSGGELSRFFLALITTTTEELPTLVFDEIDTGIGGLTLNKVASKLKELSKKHQVILVTHWPQLACLAQKHFRVKKEVINSQTISRCDTLTGDEIFEELSRMAGGGPQGKALATQLLYGG
ncbi:DNA repair protein RecN [Desulfothermus naphthae]